MPWLRPEACRPVLRYLKNIGVPLDRFIERNRLPSHRWGENRDIIPRHAFGCFLTDITRSQGIEKLGWEAVHWLRKLADNNVYSIQYAPTLYQALKDKVAHSKAVCSIEVGLVERQHSLLLSRRQSFALSDHDHEMAWFMMATFLGVVRGYIGQDWRPARMGVPSGAMEPWVSEELPDIQIETDERHWWFEIPRHYLILAPPGLASTTGCKAREQSAERGALIGLDYPSILAGVIRAYLPSGAPSLEVAADLLGTSPRTMRRRLHQANHSYRKVLAGVQFRRAKELLDSGDSKIIDIANEVGFESASNFTRAFRSFTGMTPTEYRRRSPSPR